MNLADEGRNWQRRVELPGVGTSDGDADRVTFLKQERRREQIEYQLGHFAGNQGAGVGTPQRVKRYRVVFNR